VYSPIRFTRPGAQNARVAIGGNDTVAPVARGRTIRWGVLSTARINRLVLAGAREADGAEVVAVASRDTQRAHAYAQEHQIPRAHGSYEALLSDAGVDAIYISLPNSFHHPWTMRALDAGKHVLCEKPYSRRADEVVEAFDAADAHGLVLSEAFMWRHSLQTQRLLELLPEIGELETVRATFAFPLADPTNVRMLPQLDGGALMDVGCYCVSGARLLAGEPERVYGEQVIGETGVDVRFTGVLRFPSGVVAELTSSFTFAHQQLEAIGTQGAISLSDPWHAHEPELVLNGQPIGAPRANLYRRQLENVSAAIRGEAPLLLGRDDAIGQARAIEALYASAERASPVTLDR
jgi:D-xylose 1-dehydrogenase (NADP+, D-xylono-1,5-lactone-forming)